MAMKNLVRSYSTSAKYYDDAYAVKSDLVDLSFYMDLAKKAGGPVLEIGCGTGRVLLPIARQGIEIHGIDNSLPMLSVLKNRLKKEAPEIRQNVRIHRGDMRHFRLNRKYSLVIMPFRPLQHMCTMDDQAHALTSAAFHLKKDGIFAFDVFFPKFEKISGGIGEEILELEWHDSTDPS
jgi:SAM-dependent methyltransferase